jgi:hypothetical protein
MYIFDERFFSSLRIFHQTGIIRKISLCSTYVINLNGGNYCTPYRDRLKNRLAFIKNCTTRKDINSVRKFKFLQCFNYLQTCKPLTQKYSNVQLQCMKLMREVHIFFKWRVGSLKKRSDYSKKGRMDWT